MPWLRFRDIVAASPGEDDTDPAQITKEQDNTPMTDAATQDLIQTMLDSGKLTDETAEDFKEFMSDINGDGLHKDDEAYVNALAERLGFTGTGKGKSTSARKPAAAKPDGPDWQERAVVAEAKVEDLEEEIDDLEKEIADLKAAAEAAPEPSEAADTVIDNEALKALLDRIYDPESGALRDISNEEAAATLKEMSEKLS